MDSLTGAGSGLYDLTADETCVVIKIKSQLRENRRVELSEEKAPEFKD